MILCPSASVHLSPVLAPVPRDSFFPQVGLHTLSSHEYQPDCCWHPPRLPHEQLLGPNAPPRCPLTHRHSSSSPSQAAPSSAAPAAAAAAVLPAPMAAASGWVIDWGRCKERRWGAFSGSGCAPHFGRLDRGQRSPDGCRLCEVNQSKSSMQCKISTHCESSMGQTPDPRKPSAFSKENFDL